jgi:hypothetical protein
MWRNRFGGGFGPVVRQNTERMDELKVLLPFPSPQHCKVICKEYFFSTIIATCVSFVVKQNNKLIGLSGINNRLVRYKKLSRY